MSAPERARDPVADVVVPPGFRASPTTPFDPDLLQTAQQRQLAGALHDGPVQQLAGAVMQMEVSLKLLAADSGAAGEALVRAREDIRDVIRQLRALIFDLRLANVADAGLPAALQEYASELAATAGWRLDPEIDAAAAKIDAELQLTLFLLAREALMNAHRHANATQVRLVLRVDPDQVSLLIADNGVGFERSVVEAKTAQERHFGLMAMDERARRLGGLAEIESRPGAGTQVRLRVPLPQSMAAAMGKAVQ